jgi:hypothetical protein
MKSNDTLGIVLTVWGLSCAAQPAEVISAEDASSSAGGGLSAGGHGGTGEGGSFGGNPSGGSAGDGCQSFGHDGLCEPYCYQGAAGGIYIPPAPPQEGSGCPVVGDELCNIYNDYASLHRCTTDGWQTLEHVSECAPPSDPYMPFNCNLPATVDGTCCPVKVNCPNYGYCDGVMWHSISECEQVEGTLGMPCGPHGGVPPCYDTVSLDTCAYLPNVRLECNEGIWQAPAIARCEGWQTPPACDPTGIWSVTYAGLPPLVAGLAAPSGRDLEVGVAELTWVWFGATRKASLSDDGCQLSVESFRRYPAGDAGGEIDETLILHLGITGETASGTVEVQRGGSQTETASGTAMATRLEP